jgi:hypothetical protein
LVDVLRVDHNNYKPLVLNTHIKITGSKTYRESKPTSKLKEILEEISVVESKSMNHL